MKNLKNIVIILSFLVVILINVILLILNISSRNTSWQILHSITSSEVIEGTKSPKFIGQILSKYSGDVESIYIAKACYIFANKILPEYRKECNTEKNITSYYNKHSGDIFILTGIKNREDFARLIDEVINLNENLIFESYKFDFKNVTIREEYIATKLYINYKDCNEIAVNVKIYNKNYTDRTSICFNIDK